jgi:hypothetical protein
VEAAARIANGYDASLVFTLRRPDLQQSVRSGMPAIPGEALDCIVYLYPDAASAANGEDAGGCGFVAAIPSEQTGLAFTYVVTNSHVVKEGNSPVVRVNTGEAQFQIISAEDRHWIIHPGAYEGKNRTVQSRSGRRGVYSWELLFSEEIVKIREQAEQRIRTVQTRPTSEKKKGISRNSVLKSGKRNNKTVASRPRRR